MIIREIQEKDAEAFLAMLVKLDHETSFMLYEPNERIKDMDKIKSIISDALKASFKIEGIKEKSIKLEGQLIDEYYMAKIKNSNQV